MKKIIPILLIGILVLALVCIHVIGFAHEQFSQSDQNNVLVYYTKYDENIYTTKEEMNNGILATVAPFVDDFLDLLPADTQSRFKNENWKIIISARKPIYIKDAEYSLTYGIGGNTNHGLRIIYVYLNSEVSDYILSDFIHEFGHFEDWEKGNMSCSNEFAEIFKDNKYYVPGDVFNDSQYHLSSEKEFFACCYKDYFLYGEKLAKEAPEVYSYIKDVVQDGNSNFISFYLRIFRN